MIFATKDCVEVYELLKTFFKMCTNLYNYVPVRPWFDDEDEQKQWGCGYREDMIAKIEQDFHNKNSVFKTKVNAMKLILSKKELIFGSMLMNGVDQ